MSSEGGRVWSQKYVKSGWEGVEPEVCSVRVGGCGGRSM